MADVGTMQMFLAEAEHIARRLKQLSAWAYEPHPGQKAFHSSQARIRALFTGNRFGKSWAAAHECHWWASGTHPFQSTPHPPVRIRVVGDGFDHGIEKVLLPIFKTIVDPRYLKGGTWTSGYMSGMHTLHYANGSTIEFMSYKLNDLGRGAQMFAGVALDLLWHDEHSPFDVWQENLTRLIDRNGRAILTLTPILGKTWEHAETYERWQNGDTGIACFTGAMTDNPHLPPEAIDAYLSSVTDPQMREIRELGVWVSLGGMVYAMWDPGVHVVPYDQNRVDNATKYVIIDPHPAKPTAVLWCAVGPKQDMFAYREYRAAKLIPEVCADIRRLSGDEKIVRYLIDPKWGWTNHSETGRSVHESYRRCGISVNPGSADKWGRIEQMRLALNDKQSIGQPGFVVMQACPRLAWEFAHKKFKPQTAAMREGDRLATIDEDDDLLVCAEYFVISSPTYFGHAPQDRNVRYRDPYAWMKDDIATPDFLGYCHDKDGL